MSIAQALFAILIFPGFFFVGCFGLAADFIDRKIYARLQNRQGPPWFQPIADLIKLLAKEDIVPACANETMFKTAPFFALAATVTSFLYMPLWRTSSLYPFSGDIIVVLYLLTIPTLAFFIGGWYSTSLFARIGSVRSLMQMFAYEVPLFIGILSVAVLASTWSFSEMMIYYHTHPGYWLFNLLGFSICIVALLGKLEKAPFDIPEAETEVVAGVFTEYSGRLLAVLRLALSIEMVVGASLLSAVFLPFGLMLSPALAFIVFIAKVMAVMAVLSLCRTVVARVRIDQMVDFCWKYLVPLALAQLTINLILKGAILP
jgi:NADH-quinone oxidoreductase subunit H